MNLDGLCLCGKVTWKFSGEFETETEGEATSCNYTACRRYGALWAYGNLEKDVFVNGETIAYTREGDKPTLRFHFRRNCGCVCYWKSIKPKGSEGFRIAVNLRLCTEPEKIESLPIDHFDGLDSFDDLPTRWAMRERYVVLGKQMKTGSIGIIAVKDVKKTSELLVNLFQWQSVHERSEFDILINDKDVPALPLYDFDEHGAWAL